MTGARTENFHPGLPVRLCLFKRCLDLCLYQNIQTPHGWPLLIQEQQQQQHVQWQKIFIINRLVAQVSAVKCSAVMSGNDFQNALLPGNRILQFHNACLVTRDQSLAESNSLLFKVQNLATISLVLDILRM